MSKQEASAPMFVMAAPTGAADDFEEDENEPEFSASSPASPPSNAPFSLFRSSLFSSSSGDSAGTAVATAGVVEGEEDEDEPESPQTKTNSSSALVATSGTEGQVSNSQAPKEGSTGASATNNAGRKQPAAPQYSKAEKQVVDMNLAIRKAPVKKLKESFVQLRAEMAPTQTALSASVRSANEAYSHSAEIDRQLSGLSERLSTLKPLFAN